MGVDSCTRPIRKEELQAEWGVGIVGSSLALVPLQCR